ncbi:hypothetical protein PHAVU_003G190800 [Phaseolus vulgaris]
MVGDKTKKLKIAENLEDTIDEKLILSIEKLQEVQDELDKINEEASDKVLEVEQKFNEIRKPVYDKRNEIIVKSIPDFWFTAFMNHPALCELLNLEDQKNFNPNPYFENTKLTKTFTFFEEGSTKITATPIKWKEGKGLPNGVNHDKNGKRGRIDISFFTWFSDSEQKDDTDEIHDEVAELIKEDLWPNPLTYFNNEFDEEDFDDEADDEEKDEEDQEDDDDEESNDI